MEGGLPAVLPSHWPFDWYRVVSERLGLTQGAFVGGHPLPEDEWLNRGSLAHYVREHPCDEGADDLNALRCDDTLVAALDRLPATLCHFDLHPRNLMVGDGDVVVIDWASVGVGVIGEDVSTLIASSVLDGHVPAHRLQDVFDEASEGYARGLTAAGLRVDAAALQRAIGALLVVRLGWVVARRLAAAAPGDPADPAAQALAAVLHPLAQAAHEDPPEGVALVGSISPRSGPPVNVNGPGAGRMRRLVAEGYDHIGGSYHALGERSGWAARPAYVQLLLDALAPGARVLDLGCGSGVPLASSLAAAGHRVVAVDVSRDEWVPARNMVMLAAACALADVEGHTQIITGTNLEEGGTYPDNTQAFMAAMDAAAQLGTMQRPRVVAPLGNFVKHEIVRAGLDVGAPLGVTWSCYRDGPTHCGHCGPCFMRRVAFEMTGDPDPVGYERPLLRVRPI